MSKIRLFIENLEVELDKDIQFAITKQFSDLTDPTAIINDWSKTVNIPFTQRNNALFGDLYREDRKIALRENLALTTVHNHSNIPYSAIDWNKGIVNYLFSSEIKLYGLSTKILEKDENGNIIRTIPIEVYVYEGNFTNTFRVNRRNQSYTYELAFVIDTDETDSPTISYVLPKESNVFTYSVYIDTIQDNYGLAVQNSKIKFSNIHINRGDKLISVDDDLFGIYFNPLKRLSFRLVNGENTILTGYAKTISTTQTDGKGYFNITLNGEIGGVFKEMLKITLKGLDKDIEDKYILDTNEYIDFEINKETVKGSWQYGVYPESLFNYYLNTELFKRTDVDYHLYNYIGFAPSNARDEGFDYTLFQKSASQNDDFASTLAQQNIGGKTFQSETRLTAEQAIPNGLNPRDIGEFRSYLQLPYVFVNKLIQMYLNKVEEVTGYKTKLDQSWFNNKNPYWRNLVMMLNKINTKDVKTFDNTYDIGTIPEHLGSDDGYANTWVRWVPTNSENTGSLAATTPLNALFEFKGFNEEYPLAQLSYQGFDVILGLDAKNKVIIDDVYNIDYKIHYTDNRMSSWPNYPKTVTQNNKLVSNQNYGTICDANEIMFGDEYVDFWQDVYKKENIINEIEYTQGKETIYQVLWPIEFARYNNVNTPCFDVKVKVDTFDGSDVLHPRWVNVKTEEEFFFTKDSVHNNVTVPIDIEGYEMPEENCYVTITARKWEPSSERRQYHSAEMDFTMRIPLQFREAIKSEDLLEFSGLYLLALSFDVNLKNINWCSKHYNAKVGKLGISTRNTAGYITILTDSGIRYNFLNEFGKSTGRGESNRYALVSERNYLRENDKYYYTIPQYYPSLLNLKITTGNKRSLSEIYLSDMWNKETKMYDVLLNYCKMFRIGIFLDDISKTLTFSPFSTYFSGYNILDWTDKVDKLKEYKVEPVSFNNKYVLFDYKDSKTVLGKEYKERFGFNYGEKELNTNYEFNNDTKKIFGKVEPSMSYSENVLSWNDLYNNLKYEWIEAVDILPYSLGDDDKHQSLFGQFYFFKGPRNFENTGRTIRISDDTVYQDALGKYFYTLAGDSTKITNISTYPNIDIYFDTDGTNSRVNNYALFNVPNETYTKAVTENVVNKNGIYDLLWSDYINEIYSANSKKVTCNIKLSVIDYSNFEFKNFIKIGNVLYMINKIFDYDMISQTTKVELITIGDVKSLIYNKFISDNSNCAFYNEDTGGNDDSIRDIVGSYTIFSGEDFGVFEDGLMILSEDQLTDYKTIQWNPITKIDDEYCYQWTDDELGIEIKMTETGYTRIDSFKVVLPLNLNSITKTIYVMNKARAISSFTIVKYKPSN